MKTSTLSPLKWAKNLFLRFSNYHLLQLRLNAIEENIEDVRWSQILSMSTRAIDWQRELDLNSGRMAAGPGLLYTLHRVLLDFPVEKILELGVGETTKLISKYASNIDRIKRHDAIDDNENWISYFNANNIISSKTNLMCLASTSNETGSNYHLPDDILMGEYDLFVIDGPRGSKSNSRSDILRIAAHFTAQSEFVVVFDDVNRNGETETLNAFRELLRAKNISTFSRIVCGQKHFAIIASENFRYTTTL